MTKVYVLMERDYGGMFSSFFVCTGKAYTSEEDAKKWVNNDEDRMYYEVEVYNDKNGHIR